MKFKRSTRDIVAGSKLQKLRKKVQSMENEKMEDVTMRLDALTPGVDGAGNPAPQPEQKRKLAKVNGEKVAIIAGWGMMIVIALVMVTLLISNLSRGGNKAAEPAATTPTETEESLLVWRSGSCLVAVPTADYLAAAKPGDLARILTADTAPGELQYLEIAAVSESSVSVYMTEAQLSAYLAVRDQCCLVLAAQGGKDAAKLLDYQARYNAPSVTLTMAEASKSIPEGGRTLLDLKIAVEPEGAPVEAVSWRSSDSDIAMVDKDGTVTGLEAGTAEITASCGGRTATCTVTVYPVATSLTLTETAAIAVGDELPLTAAVEPVDINDTVRWTSSDEAVATVSKDGVVIGAAPGTCEITAICGGLAATCQVTVQAPAERIVLNTDALTLAVGATGTLQAETTPADAAGPITWASSDEGIATVDAGGVVTGKKAGTCRITVSCGAVSAACVVTVQ